MEKLETWMKRKIDHKFFIVFCSRKELFLRDGQQS